MRAPDCSSVESRVTKQRLLLSAGSSVKAFDNHVQLFRDVQTGLVWMTKILTDPFHDIKLYHMAPLYLLRGELFDSMSPEQHVCD